MIFSWFYCYFVYVKNYVSLSLDICFFCFLPLLSPSGIATFCACIEYFSGLLHAPSSLPFSFFSWWILYYLSLLLIS